MVGSLQLLLWVAAVALVPRQAAARFQGSGARDTVHKVFKVKVTDEWRAPTSWSGGDGVLLLKADKRGDDASACPTSYALCAASLGGNCCPDNYACSKDYCYATTAVTTSTATCQGNVGYYACAASLGGGCCPQGMCARPIESPPILTRPLPQVSFAPRVTIACHPPGRPTPRRAPQGISSALRPPATGVA